MNDQELLVYLRSQRWAIQASSATSGRPQAAIIGYAATDDLELVFDTLTSSRKAANLRANPRIALVIGGWQDESPRTLQLEGVVDVPVGEDLQRVKRTYLSVFPDGRERESLPDITYLRVRPDWIRFSDYTVEPPSIVERRVRQ
jgi:general stress protein 26